MRYTLSLIILFFLSAEGKAMNRSEEHPFSFIEQEKKMPTISVFTQPPENFHPTFFVSGCYCKYGEQILFLKRSPHKSLGGAWGIPAGKLKEKETPLEAALREVAEETGITLKQEEVSEVGTFYVRHSADGIFHVFQARFLSPPSLNLNMEEHSESRWLTAAEALKLPFITGGIKILQLIE